MKKLTFSKVLTALMLSVGCSPSVPEVLDAGSTTLVNDFTQDLDTFFTPFNAAVLPQVSVKEGRYHAIVSDNTNDKTLHFNQHQGRLDAVKVQFPFRVIARNIGVGTLQDSQVPPGTEGDPVIFAGIQVHDLDMNKRDSAHIVVGHRWRTHYTVEGKNTVDGKSSVSDEGANAAPNTRADLLIIGNKDRTLTVFWQLPVKPGEKDQWKPYGKKGKLPGMAPSFGESVYVGLITYAQKQAGLPFVGTADEFWLNY